MSTFNEEEVEAEFIDEFCQIKDGKGNPVFDREWHDPDYIDFDLVDDALDPDEQQFGDYGFQLGFSDPNDDWDDDKDDEPFDDDSF